MVAILIGALVGVGTGFMVGFSLFGFWGGLVGAVVGVGAGAVIMGSIRRWARKELPEQRGGTVEVAGTDFHPPRHGAGDTADEPRRP